MSASEKELSWFKEWWFSRYSVIARNAPGCTWTGANPRRMIHVEDYKKGAVYEDLGD